MTFNEEASVDLTANEEGSVDLAAILNLNREGFLESTGLETPYANGCLKWAI